MSEISTVVLVDNMFSTAATQAHFDINAVGMDLLRLQRRLKTASEMLRNTAVQPGCPTHYAQKFEQLADEIDTVDIAEQIRTVQSTARSLEMLVKRR